MSMKFTVDDVKAQKRLRDLATRVDPAIVRIVNRVATATRLKLSKTITSKIALPATYVRERLLLAPATVAKPVATIAAKQRGVLVSRFKWRQLFERNKTKPGRHAAGVEITITPGKKVFVRKWFVIPTLKNDNGPGIAIRTGKGRDAYEVLHGPSVSQVFSSVRPDVSEETRTTLAAAVQREITRLAELISRS